MKTLAVCLLLLFSVVGCTTTPTAPTERQRQIADAVEDVISIGLVPVLSRNPAYLTEAGVLSSALSLFSESAEFNPANSEYLLAKTAMSPEDRRLVSGILNAAWTTYSRRYAQQVSTILRPDVRLFLTAVGAGIANAIAATPK